jgi:hypothetical protein
MKSAKQWVDEYSQSGAFDLVEDCNEAELIVQQIQQDTVNELQRLRSVIQVAVSDFENIRWGADGDCGSGQIMEKLEEASQDSNM